MNLNAEGQRVIVTAGGSGIGRAIAQTFHDAGARVHVCDIAPETLDECRRAGLGATPGRRRRSGAGRSAVRRGHGRARRARCAGQQCRRRRAVQRRRSDEHRGLGPHHRGQSQRHVLLHPPRRADVEAGRRRADRQHVIGRGADGVPVPLGLLGVEMGDRRPDRDPGDGARARQYRVNAIQPGIVDGERHWRNAKRKAELLGITLDEQERRVLSRVSLRRMVTPQDIGNMALFLASNWARTFPDRRSACAAMSRPWRLSEGLA